MLIPKKKATISLILKLAVVLSATAGVALSALSSSETFMGGSVVFMYFTIQSNIAIALVSLIGGLLFIRGKAIGNVWYVIKFVATVSITLTGAVFTFILAPTLGSFAWKLQNVLTHVVVPLAAIIDFFVTGPYGNVKRSSVFFVTLPPLAYGIYAVIGYVAGWEFSKGKNYPYFFLNWGSPAGAFGFTKELPFMGCVWWIIALLILLLAVGYVYLVIVDVLKKTAVKRN
ncbi:MAG: Pr6Pr family membrane protein [Clostridia bacterium]|nr:Pr6Pr family membrane protein [Clostridia bacterium]